MSILGAVIMPHPPVLLPEVGRGREEEIRITTEACRQAARFVKELEPEVLVITSPHTICYRDYFHISPGTAGVGDFSGFGARQVRVETRYDGGFRAALLEEIEEAGLSAGTQGERDPSLDHGVMIPLSFMQETGVNCPVIRIGLSGFGPLEHYQLGVCIQRAAEKLGRRTVILASGDLSHKLTADGPYGFAPDGPVFDRQAIRAMEEGDFLSLLTMDAGLCERAAECGLRSFQIMAGALDGLGVDSKLLSYEGPFGVGYGVAFFRVYGRDEGRSFAEPFVRAEKIRLAERKAGEDPCVRLARLSLENRVRTRKPLSDLPEDLPPELTGRRAGCFVSLHIRGQLRGCIGTIAPTRESLAREIVDNAVSAGLRDYRFSRVEEWELEQLEYNVDVLGEPEPIDGPEQLDVKKYGVIVTCDDRRGLLLPDLDGVDSVEQQIKIAREKGGIGPYEPYTLERFEVVRHL